MPLVPREREGRARPIEAIGVWLTIEEAAVLVGLLEVLALPEMSAQPEIDELRERWLTRLGARMSEAMTGLSPDGFERGESAAD